MSTIMTAQDTSYYEGFDIDDELYCDRVYQNFEKLIKDYPIRNITIVYLYIVERKSFRNIGHFYNISRSRVQQLYSKTIEALKAHKDVILTGLYYNKYDMQKINQKKQELQQLKEQHEQRAKEFEKHKRWLSQRVYYNPQTEMDIKHYREQRKQRQRELHETRLRNEALVKQRIEKLKTNAELTQETRLRIQREKEEQQKMYNSFISSFYERYRELATIPLKETYLYAATKDDVTKCIDNFVAELKRYLSNVLETEYEPYCYTEVRKTTCKEYRITIYHETSNFNRISVAENIAIHEKRCHQYL